jgi:hypothetical protein
MGTHRIDLICIDDVLSLETPPSFDRLPPQGKGLTTWRSRRHWALTVLRNGIKPLGPGDGDINRG